MYLILLSSITGKYFAYYIYNKPSDVWKGAQQTHSSKLPDLFTYGIAKEKPSFRLFPWMAQKARDSYSKLFNYNPLKIKCLGKISQVISIASLRSRYFQNHKGKRIHSWSVLFLDGVFSKLDIVQGYTVFSLLNSSSWKEIKKRASDHHLSQQCYRSQYCS